MGFLIDTDICSAYLKGNRLVWGRFVQYGGNLYLSAVTVAELYTWTKRATAPAARAQGVRDLVRDVNVLEINLDVAQKFGEVQAALLDQGRTTGPMDLLNAATALTHGLALVTHNVADYVHVPGLAVSDWLMP